MVLYVDETENNHYFIVTGLLVPSQKSIEIAYKQFKKKVNTMKLKPKIKEKIFNEFKSTILDREFQRIKVKMLEEIMQVENQTIYSCYLKKGENFNQSMKEEQYINLLNNIVSFIKKDVDIIFDSFNKADFEQKIIESISQHSNVISIQSKNSFDDPGIQFVDNLCSVIRLSYLDSKNYYYSIIGDKVIQV